jgi:hypothetical protein
MSKRGLHPASRASEVHRLAERDSIGWVDPSQSLGSVARLPKGLRVARDS